jgi:hypothetical protein
MVNLVIQEDFNGPELSDFWIGGQFNHSKEVKMEINNGLRISFVKGVQYASAGAVTKNIIVGDFEAEIKFEVSNPVHGSTFELAAIQVEPPEKTSITPVELTAAHRVFNVHGSPPYISSELDESDGWRIGWNYGIKQGGWDDEGEWRSDNSDNKYGKPLMGPITGVTTGWLKLSRTNGTTWIASGRKLETDPWQEVGRQNTAILSGPIRLRLVAKHWVKTKIGAIIAPSNDVVFSNFKMQN